MAWLYHFVDLTTAQKEARRSLLDRYGIYAQLSAVIPIALYQIYRFCSWMLLKYGLRSPGYAPIPSSPTSKSLKMSRSGSFALWRPLQWWLGRDAVVGYGTRGQLLLTLTWATWLLFLCVHRTGDDYLHLTKRFGIVATANLPLHYMLSMKSIISPVALAFGTSHESLNLYHRISGRLIYTFLLLHAIFYVNFFIQSGILWKRLSDPVVILGMLSITSLSGLILMSREAVRRWNYRVFFVVHLMVAMLMLPALFLHANSLRIYILEAFVAFVTDIVARKLDTVQVPARITTIPHTKLVKIDMPIPASKLERYQAAPGQHVYISIPPQSGHHKSHVLSIHGLLFNPFTVAEVHANSITLVFRSLHGPTTRRLEQLAHMSKANPPLNVEGPYGHAQYFPNFVTEFERILLIAGGVGGTFIMPIYSQIKDTLSSEKQTLSKVEMIWAMKSAAEASWATEGRLLEAPEPDPVRLFFSQAVHEHNIGSQLLPDSSIEMSDLQYSAGANPNIGTYARPDFAKIVDRTFSHGKNERVAVVVCGPKGMADDVKNHVRRWADGGREIFWHNEAFGW